MRFIEFILGASLIALSTAALGAPETTRLEAGHRLQKNVFSGSESRISAYNIVLSDCSSGPIPAVRLVKEPAKGTIRFNPTRIPINRAKDSARAQCNGMQAEALGVYYTAPESYAGVEEITIDVDWRNGRITRYIYKIIVR